MTEDADPAPLMRHADAMGDLDRSDADDGASVGARTRVAIGMLAFGVFVVGTGEFMLAGLLPLMSRTFEVPITTAAQIITAFALTCGVAGPILTGLTGHWQNRTVLIAATGVYLVGSGWSAVAGSYGQLVAGQVVAAAGVGVLVPTSTTTAAALVAPRHRGRAIAFVVTGFTVATGLGAPLGTALGGLVDWRLTMWAVAGLACLASLGMASLVPRRMSAPCRDGLIGQLRHLANPRYAAILATTLLAFTAIYIPYTYIGAIFAPATKGDSVSLATLMLTVGVIGTAGNLLAGWLSDRQGPVRVIAAALSLLVASFLGIPFATGRMVAAVGVIGVYGLAAFAITSPQQHRLVGLGGEDAPVLIALNQAVIYVAIALSAIVGGLGIGFFGPRNVSLLAGAIALAALAMSQLAHRLARHR